MLIDDLELKKEDIYNISSLKEQVFYKFLVGERLSCPTDNDLAENVQICLSVFCINAPSKKDLIEKHRKTQPKKGLHYTTNLIDLCAIAKDYFEQERDNLMSYCQNNSTRDFFILKHIFPDLIHYPPKPLGNIDQIALHLYKGDYPPEGWKSLLLNALYETSDLIDFYIVEQGFLQAMDDHPIVHRVNEIAYVRDACKKFVEKTERNVKWTIRTFIILLLGPTSYWLGTLSYKNWDKAEPIIAIIEFSASLIEILIIVFFVFIPNKVKIVKSLWEKIMNWMFRIKGFNRSKLKEKITQLK